MSDYIPLPSEHIPLSDMPDNKKWTMNISMGMFIDINTVGLDEAKVREYIKNQETDDMMNDKYEVSDPSDLF